ncbi:HIT family protein [Brevibacterium salitolerans]|uniref:HIT family protein n=1 Tax=Brevibacterium salitolerans TaxID=1403566 RepID=A0ABN2WRY7_9MICO
MSDCVFCRITAGAEPSVTVFEDESTLAFMDAFPGSDGHLLVVPKRHSRDLLEIPEDDLLAVTRTARRLARAVVEELGADGVNLLNNCGAQAWQSVFHFHMHVIPRYADGSKDSLTLPWPVGVPGDPELRADLGARLTSALQG